MPIKLNGTQYYRTSEACQMAGITKNTYLRWVAGGLYPDVEFRDRRGWRLFTESDLERLIREVNRVQVDGGARSGVSGSSERHGQDQK